MLIAGLAPSLSTYQDQRHEIQARMVEMVAEVLLGVQEGMQKTIGEWEGKSAGLKDEKLAREAAVQEAQDKLAGKCEEVLQKKEALTETAKAFVVSKEELSAAEAAQVTGDKELSAALERKEKLLATMKDLIKPLSDGSVED